MLPPDRWTTIPISQKDTPSIRFLYNTVPGRMALRLLVCPGVSKAAGFVLDRSISRFFVAPFVKSSGICLDDYEVRSWHSFNDFFTRQVRPGLRPLPEDKTVLAAPCDGKLTVYPITDDAVFRIKHSAYDLASLLEDKNLAERYRGGTCLIFRLTPDDYHRYGFPDDGQLLSSRRIPGLLHTVRPIAFDHCPVYLRNAREYALLRTVHFGDVVQMEVGALFVGRIVNNSISGPFRREDEKGKFEFGGSTIVLLLEKDAAVIHPTLRDNTAKGLETVVKKGYPLSI